VNATDRLRVISNTSVMLRHPPAFGGPGERAPIVRAALAAMGVEDLDFEATGERKRIVPERERRWKDGKASRRRES
jgi:hypothetical protein